MSTPAAPAVARPLIYGHRGAGRGSVAWRGSSVTESTVESFLAAVDAGADGVETDAVRTADGQLVCHHDSVLADGTPIAALTLAALRRRGVPGLTEAFAALPAHVAMIVESKPVLDDVEQPAHGTTTALVAAALRAEHRARGRALLTYGFDPSTTPQLAGWLAGSGVGLGLIAEGGTDLALMTHAAVRLGATVVAGHTSSFLGGHVAEQLRPHTAAQVIAAGHRHGLRYLCWTPDAGQAAEVLAGGVDELCIDDVPTASRACCAASPPCPGRCAPSAVSRVPRTGAPARCDGPQQAASGGPDARRADPAPPAAPAQPAHRPR